MAYAELPASIVPTTMARHVSAPAKTKAAQCVEQTLASFAGRVETISAASTTNVEKRQYVLTQSKSKRRASTAIGMKSNAAANRRAASLVQTLAWEARKSAYRTGPPT